MTEPDLMTSAEVASFFRRKCTKTVLAWHHSGKLPAAIRLDNGEYLWARADVEAFRAARAPATVKVRAEKAEAIKAALDVAYARSVLRRGRSA